MLFAVRRKTSVCERRCICHFRSFDKIKCPTVRAEYCDKRDAMLHGHTYYFALNVRRCSLSILMSCCEPSTAQESQY